MLFLFENNKVGLRVVCLLFLMFDINVHFIFDDTVPVIYVGNSLTVIFLNGYS